MGWLRALAILGIREVMPDEVREIHDEVQESKEAAGELIETASIENHHKRVAEIGETIETVETARQVYRGLKKR